MKKKKITTEIKPMQTKKSYKRFIIPVISIIALAWIAYAVKNHIEVRSRIKQYEMTMNKRTYSACGVVDEEGTYATITDWKEDDPELRGFPIEDGTGMRLPIKDHFGNIIKDLPPGYPGIKDMKIPFIRGFRWSDGYGASNCIPCAKANVQEEINICNSRYLYINMSIGDSNEKIDIENIDEANPALVMEIPDQESDEEILQQQAKGWSGEMGKSGAFSEKSEQAPHEKTKGY